MKNLETYISLPADERLDVFLSTLSITNRTPEYYVNWEKVDCKTKQYELELNTLNYLIGKKNIKTEATRLFSKQPELLKVIPSLMASRDSKLDILMIDDNDKMMFENLDFHTISQDRLDDYIWFMESSGLLNFLKNTAKRSLVDYVYGVETGLDSNARKNRSGSIMEGIIERHITRLAQLYHLEVKPQATATYILSEWGIHIPVDKSARKFDIAVYSKEKHKVYLMETNYYGGGGSKLKSVSGEFTSLYRFLQTSTDNIEFIWITDGQGWKTARLPLLEAFQHLPYIFNLNMINHAYLDNLFSL